MSKRNKKKVSIAVVCMMLTVCVGRTPAWGPVAHSLITREAAKDAGKPVGIRYYASLPDYVDSHAISFWSWGAVVAPVFQWGHAAQGLGVFDRSGFNCPYIPVEAKDGRRPGLVMYELVQNKLDITDEQRKRLLLTAYGFIAHNAADRVIHYEYATGVPKSDCEAPGYSEQYSHLLGGDGSGGAPPASATPAAAWALDHGMKEVWIEYELLLGKVLGAEDHEKLFVTAEGADCEGAIDIFTDPTRNKLVEYFPWNQSAAEEDLPPRLRFKGSAKLMHLAQLVHRKNRRRLGYAGEEQLSVQEASVIREEIEAKRQNMHAFFLPSHSPWGKWQGEIPIVGWPVDVLDNTEETIKYYPWDSEDETWSSTAEDLPTGPPSNNLEEYRRLQGYAQFSIDQKTGWRVWDTQEIGSRYNSAVDAVRDGLLSLN